MKFSEAVKGIREEWLRARRPAWPEGHHIRWDVTHSLSRFGTANEDTAIVRESILLWRPDECVENWEPGGDVLPTDAMAEDWEFLP